MITFQRDGFVLRIRKKKDTYHTVIEMFLAAFLSIDVEVIDDD